MQKVDGFESEKETARKMKKLLAQVREISAREPDKDKILHYLNERNIFLRQESEIVWMPSPAAVHNAIGTVQEIETNTAVLYKECVFALSRTIERLSHKRKPAFILTLEILFSSTSLRSGCMWSFYYFLLWDQYCTISSHLQASNFAKYLTDAYLCGLGFLVFYNEVIYAVPIPELTINSRDVLHKDLGPAVVWSDGAKEYCLNGVQVPQEVAETPAEQLSPGIILQEKNAEIRREIVSKIGIEEVIASLGCTVMDTKGDYELVLLNMQGDRKRPYLRMRNPSIGVYHLEGVPPDIKTVEEALVWRNQTKEEPVIVT